MSLKEYRKKRHFGVTPEPAGGKDGKDKKIPSRIFVVQKHRATQLHYDFRLEWNGTLLSWAVPKGPSLDPSVKRLAMQVEDHPVSYFHFEGIIPEGNYGAGTVMVWDLGTWEPVGGDPHEMLAKGDFKFNLHGEKLNGGFVLARMKSRRPGSKGTEWLLIKHRDEFASTEDIVTAEPKSAVSKRLLAEIARDSGGDVEKAATGDPQAATKTARRKTAAKSRPAKSKKRKQRE